MHHLHAALERVDEAILVLSGAGQIKYSNRSARAFFPDGVCLPSEVWEVLLGGSPWEGRLEVLVGDEPRRLHTWVRPVSGGAGERNYVVAASDVTEVERLKSIAQSVNLSDNIGHFLSGIRHELGNPTNSIKTALTVLRANLHAFEGPKIYEYLDHVLAEVGRIEHLLRSLRSFTAHESVQPKAVEIGEIIDRVASLVRPDMRRAGVEFVVTPSPAGAIYVDERAFYQVFINLVSNAIEAVEGMPEPSICITTSCLPGDRVEIVVSDNGTGISDSQIRKVVQPFYTTKRTGTGLGLAIVERLVERHDGELRLESEPWGGTRAVIRLPFSPGLQAAEAS